VLAIAVKCVLFKPFCLCLYDAALWSKLGIGFSGISDPGTRTGNESGTRVPVRFFGLSLYVSNNAVCEKLRSVALINLCSRFQLINKQLTLKCVT
jgi:hypothetical protein